MLVVVVAAAGIRLGLGWLRPVHRIAASLEVIVVLWLAWIAWRARAERPVPFRVALLAIAISAFLSIVGIVAGQNPPTAAAFANLLGGLALAATFAWLLALAGGGTGGVAAVVVLAAGILLTLQAFVGARLAIVSRVELPALPAHAMTGLVLAALLAWAGLSRIRGWAGAMLFALALIVPAAGFTALHYDHSPLAALAHAAVAALLLVSVAHACARKA